MDHYQETFETWNKIASLYQERFMDLDLYNESYDLICASITGIIRKLLKSVADLVISPVTCYTNDLTLLYTASTLPPI